jgi:hypothetical protein
LGKPIKDWQPAHAGWRIHATKVHVVEKEAATPARPTLLKLTPANENESPCQETNPLDCMTWEERFWYAFQAIVELERDLEELQVREEFFRCLTCRRESGLL